MHQEDGIEKVRRKFARLSAVLDERGRRLWAAVEADALGYGGQSIVAKAPGLSRVTLRRESLEKGEETLARAPSEADRIRKAGGGRKKLTHHEPRLLSALEALVEPTTRGDPSAALDVSEYSSISRRLGRAGLSNRPPDGGFLAG